MKLNDILNESDFDLDAFKAQLRKASDEVDSERKAAADKADEKRRADSAKFSQVESTFNTPVRFRAMLSVLNDKGSRTKQKSRGGEYDPEDVNSQRSFYDEETMSKYGETVFNDMVKSGLINKRGGIEPFAAEYLEFVLSDNIGKDYDSGVAGDFSGSPSDRAAPRRYTPGAADELTGRGERGNFPRGVSGGFKASDSRARRVHGGNTLGQSKEKLLQRVEDTLKKVQFRLKDKKRVRARKSN